MKRQHHRLQNLILNSQKGVFLVLLSLPFWTACSNNEEEAAIGFTIPYVWPHESVSKDDFVPNIWLGISISDRFDDTVMKKIIYNSTEDAEILLFDRAIEESECLTEMLVRFPYEVLPTGAWQARGETKRAAIETRENDKEFYPTVPVSFNFKRHDSDDIKILDQEFRDSTLFNMGGSDSIDLRNDNDTDLESYITALRDSYEVRVKAEFKTFRLDFKVDLQNFSEKYTSLTEVCEDKMLDFAGSDDEEKFVQKEIEQ